MQNPGFSEQSNRQVTVPCQDVISAPTALAKTPPAAAAVFSRQNWETRSNSIRLRPVRKALSQPCCVLRRGTAPSTLTGGAKTVPPWWPA